MKDHIIITVGIAMLTGIIALMLHILFGLTIGDVLEVLP